MMGDNSPSSSDSRVWGCVPRARLMGRAWLVAWPFSRCKIDSLNVSDDFRSLCESRRCQNRLYPTNRKPAAPSRIGRRSPNAPPPNTRPPSRTHTAEHVPAAEHAPARSSAAGLAGRDAADGHAVSRCAPSRRRFRSQCRDPAHARAAIWPRLPGAAGHFEEPMRVPRPPHLSRGGTLIMTAPKFEAPPSPDGPSLGFGAPDKEPGEPLVPPNAHGPALTETLHRPSHHRRADALR